MKIVISNNSLVYDELASDDFQLVNAEPIIVTSGEEAVAATAEHLPELVVVDANLPGIDGYTVCERIKADADLKAVRVIIVLHGAISSRQLNRLANCGCDDVVVYREEGETLYHHAARLLSLPEPSLAQPVTLEVVIANSRASAIKARATRLSATGVELRVSEPVAVGTRLKLRLTRTGDASSVDVTGTVTQSTPDAKARAELVAVAFDQLSVRARAQLADLALWDRKQLPGGVRITLRGAFDEKCDFSNIQVGDTSKLIFDVGGVGRINSWGARQWIMFLRSLPDELEYCFVNASTEFVKHCNMVTDMLGRGSMVSFAATYVCGSCQSSNDRILQVSSISPAIVHEPPEFRCPKCAGTELFDEVPFRYFAFLKPGCGDDT